MNHDSSAVAKMSFAERLRNAGIKPGDSAQERLNKSLLVFATGLFSFGSMLWLSVYWILGPQFDTTWPLVFELILVGNLLIYIQTGNFDFFRISQLALFLFAPFAAQWNIGSFIDASGVVLWGLLGPIGALLCCSRRESMPWFIAWVTLTAMSGFFDFYLADTALLKSAIPIHTSVVFFALNFIAVATLIYVLLNYSIREQENTKLALQHTLGLLQAEQDRSEKLLLNTLPEPIAQRLKNSGEIIADGYGCASVMFADIVDFTKIALGMTPLQVFATLNSIFSAFDDLTEKHNLEKIKTIGDAYMVAGGINNGAGDHVAAMADLAIAMHDILRNDPLVNPLHLKIHIGIATGPVIAGVLGKNKFIYDLWGETVNLASRITSSGVPGATFCDFQTWQLLHARFEIEGPQTYSLKGLGSMPIYRLIGRKFN